MTETRLLAGVTVKVTHKQDRRLIVTVEVVRIDQRTVALRVGEETRTLLEGDVLNIEVPLERLDA